MPIPPLALIESVGMLVVPIPRGLAIMVVEAVVIVMVAVVMSLIVIMMIAVVVTLCVGQRYSQKQAENQRGGARNPSSHLHETSL
jgi:hypothetical protein